MVRAAAAEDVPAILSLGLGDPAFRVSDRIPFYERTELEEWIQEPRDNILLVAVSAGSIAGFLFCKVMSSHWAMLDNFYVQPSFRGRSLAELLLGELRKRLRQRGIAYLTTLTSQEDLVLARYLRRLGFRQAKQYAWHELFLDDPTGSND